MNPFLVGRRRAGLSQRRFAARAGLSFRTVQLLERNAQDARMSTIARAARALGCRAGAVTEAIAAVVLPPEEDVAQLSRRLVEGKNQDWKIYLFDFIDAFRRRPRRDTISFEPDPRLAGRMLALLASVVEQLCVEKKMSAPLWCSGAGALPSPWFVSDMENLKAMALAESPVRFRRRNIFVLANFMSRA